MGDQPQEKPSTLVEQEKRSTHLTSQYKFIQERCTNSQIDVAGRLKWIDQMYEVIQHARSKAK